MKKYLLLILTVLISLTGLKAQDHKRDWKGGKLTWDDFQEQKTGKGFSYFKYLLGYNQGKQKYGDTVIVKAITFGYMDKSSSWVKSDFKTDQCLRYNQIVFDIVELYRRKLQYELNRVYSTFELENTLNAISAACASKINDFQIESNNGQNVDSVNSWEQKITDELSIASKEDQIPPFEKGNFGYGIHAGFGAGMFTESLGDYFTPTFNFIFGFDLALKRSILFLNGTFALSRVRKDYLSDQQWYEKEFMSVIILDVSYGYAILDRAKFKLTPFAGFGMTVFTPVNNDGKPRSVNYNAIFGINADYKIRVKVKLIPGLFYKKEKVETSIRARLYASRIKYHSDLKGFTINLTFGIGGFGNTIRLHR